MLHHRGVEADAAMEQEVPPIDGAEPYPGDGVPVEGVEEHARGLDRVVGQADDAGEHVGAAPRQRRQGSAGAGQAVGGLVECAVPAQHDHQVDAVGGGRPGQPGGVAAPDGLGQGHLMVG